jgi:hypothetical protein
MRGNVHNIFRLPAFVSPLHIEFPKFDGFAFYLANPIFVCLGLRIASEWKKLKDIDALILAGCLIQLVFVLCHRTMGGWHFGTRYLVDMLPFVVLLILRLNPKPSKFDDALCVFGVALNVYGAHVMWTPH